MHFLQSVLFVVGKYVNTLQVTNGQYTDAIDVTEFLIIWIFLPLLLTLAIGLPLVESLGSGCTESRD